MAILGSTNLTGCNSIPDFILGGSLVTFQQSAAPPSWTKEVTHNNKALRVVTGTATPGGSTAFSSVFASRPVTGSVTVALAGGSVNNHTLTTPQIPSHAHTVRRFKSAPLSPTSNLSINTPGNAGQLNPIGPTTTPAGLDGAHNHPFTQPTATGEFTGTALNFAVLYVDIIICSKN